MRENLVIAALLATGAVGFGAGAMKDNIDASLAKNPDYTRSVDLAAASNRVQSSVLLLGPHQQRQTYRVVAAEPLQARAKIAEAIAKIGDTDTTIDDRLAVVAATLPEVTVAENSPHLTEERSQLTGTRRELESLSATYLKRVPFYELYGRKFTLALEGIGKLTAAGGLTAIALAGINRLPFRNPKIAKLN